jgi:SAM-dependent methyltransferase
MSLHQAGINQTFPFDLLCCSKKNLQNQVCRGKLLSTSCDKLTCDRCGFQYQKIHNAPILKADDFDSVDGWFENMYQNRSRSEEIQTNYLSEERKFMHHFFQENSVKGQCLEIGCGVGLFAEIVPNFLGLEYSMESLFATGFESFNRMCADARVIPLIDSCVECIYSFNTLEHVPNVDMAFSEMDRVLKPGGFLVLKPAWHCTAYNTELIPILPYKDLNLRQAMTKLILPLLTSKVFKFLTRVPWRIFRRIVSSKNNSLSWTPLIPYHGPLWISDSDAVASIDSHEAILFYTSRGYECISHKNMWKQLAAGHDIIVLQKK